jgi:hypothetical protein
VPLLAEMVIGFAVLFWISINSLLSLALAVAPGPNSRNSLMIRPGPACGVSCQSAFVAGALFGEATFPLAATLLDFLDSRLRPFDFAYAPTIENVNRLNTSKPIHLPRLRTVQLNLELLGTFKGLLSEKFICFYLHNLCRGLHQGDVRTRNPACTRYQRMLQTNSVIPEMIWT